MNEFFAGHHLVQGRYRLSHSRLVQCLIEAVNQEHSAWLENHWSQITNKNQITYKYQDILVDCISQRSRQISVVAPEYWRKVTKPQMASLLVKLKPSLPVRIGLRELYPELYPELALLDRLALQVLDQPNSFVSAYLLGFPIHRYLPSEKELLKSAKRLTELGKQCYVDSVGEHNQTEIEFRCTHHGLPSYWPTMVEPFPTEEKVLRNMKDNLEEYIHDYPPYDILLVQTGIFFNAFTRPAFNQLQKSEKNSYNGESLDPSVLLAIKDRQTRARLMNLPKSKPLLDLLTSLEENTLEFPEGQSSSSPQTSTQANDGPTEPTGSTSSTGHPVVPLSVLRPSQELTLDQLVPGSLVDLIRTVINYNS